MSTRRTNCTARRASSAASDSQTRAPQPAGRDLRRPSPSVRQPFVDSKVRRRECGCDEIARATVAVQVVRSRPAPAHVLANGARNGLTVVLYVGAALAAL